MEIAEAVGHNKISINIVWTLITGYLVMFMQLGFALVETGFTRAKNASHTMLMNMMVYVVGMLGFWICGFAFMFGGVGLAAAVGAMERTCERPVIWATAQYLSYARPPSVGVSTMSPPCAGGLE